MQLLRAYKWAISPLFPPACRYVPTCSEYAMEAVERYGALRGGLKAVARLLRCHPFARGGYDPVVSPQHICGETTRDQLTNLKRPATPASYHGAIRGIPKLWQTFKIVNKNPAAKNACSWCFW